MDKFLRKRPADEDDDGAPVFKKMKGTKPKHQKVRKFQPEYIRFGFCSSDDGEKPQCVICGEVLSNDALKPAKLKRHLQSKHPERKSEEYFQRMRANLKHNKAAVHKYTRSTKSFLRASFATRIAKNKKPHIIGEELILPAAIEMCSLVLGEKAAREIAKISLSDNTATSYIRNKY